MFEHTDETLVKLGDKFDSLESFRLYVDGNAKHWKYYLKCSDSHRKDGKDIFVFQCVLARKRTKFSLAKGVRKRYLYYFNILFMFFQCSSHQLLTGNDESFAYFCLTELQQYREVTAHAELS